MSCDRSIASYKAGTLSTICCFHFHFAVSSILLKVIQLRRTSSSSSSCHIYPSLLSFPHKRVLEISFSPDLCAILLRFSHDRYNLSSPSFSSTTFQKFPGISDLLSEVSKFQHNTNLCSKYSTLLCVISGFLRQVDKNCSVLGYYAASSGNFLPTLVDNL